MLTDSMEYDIKDELVEVNKNEIVVEDIDIEKELMEITNDELLVKLNDGMKICNNYIKQIEDDQKLQKHLKCTALKACIMRGGCPASFVHNQDLLYYLKLIYTFMDRSVDVELKENICNIMDGMMDIVTDHPVFNSIKHDRIERMLTLIKKNSI